MTAAEGAPNPYLRRAAPAPPTPASLGVRELSADECWLLIRRQSLGRFAFPQRERAPLVFPMNYLVFEDTLIVRSAPGTKLENLLHTSLVTFELDGSDRAHWWSVVMEGCVRRMDADDEIEQTGAVDLVSWNPVPKFDFLRITPTLITGRRFPNPTHHPASDGHRVLWKSPIDNGRLKPSPIPHLPPARQRGTGMDPATPR